MLQNDVKKKQEKWYNISKKHLTLHRFNKQMIVLQILKAKKMKKLVLMFVAIAAISFASCGNKNQSAASANDSDTTLVDTASADSAVADTTVADTANAQ